MWSDFGGNKKRQDKFHSSWTAAREHEEETIGLTGTYRKYLSQLKDYKRSRTYRINNTSDDYIMYMTPTNYVHPFPQRFRLERFHTKNLASKNKEKVDVAWTSVRSIMNSLERATNFKNVRVPSVLGASLLLRQPFVRTLSIAHEKGILDKIARNELGNASVESKPYITANANRLSNKPAMNIRRKLAGWFSKKLQTRKQKSLEAE